MIADGAMRRKREEKREGKRKREEKKRGEEREAEKERGGERGEIHDPEPKARKWFRSWGNIIIRNTWHVFVFGFMALI